MNAGNDRAAQRAPGEGGPTSSPPSPGAGTDVGGLDVAIDVPVADPELEPHPKAVSLVESMDRTIEHTRSILPSVDAAGPAAEDDGEAEGAVPVDANDPESRAPSRLAALFDLLDDQSTDGDW